MANTKITNPELFNLGDSTSATQLPVMTITERIAMNAPITTPFNIDYLVVAGGGAGGGGGQAGGGGAGGLRTNYGGASLTLNTATAYTVTVGAGGIGTGNGVSGSGSNSVFDYITSTITSAGGGGGAIHNISGADGGSGGGAGTQQTGGSGNTPSTTPSQGNAGGSGGTYNFPYSGGGGGGYVSVGSTGGNVSGNGGTGIAYTAANSITGSALSLAGGGGGGTYSGAAGTATNGGGAGFSGTGTTAYGSPGTPGTDNTGGGGGGTGNYQVGTIGASGGSGVVILRYPTADIASYTATGLTPTETTDGTDTILSFTTVGTGTITFTSSTPTGTISTGEMIFNSTTDKVEYFDGTKWYGITSYIPANTNIFNDNSCIAYYRFNGNADDETGNYNATASNETYSATGGKEGGYISLPQNSSGTINTNDSGVLAPGGTNVRSYSIWVQFQETGQYDTIWSQWRSSPTPRRTSFYIRKTNVGQIQVVNYLSNSSSAYYTTTTNNAFTALNSWYNIVVSIGQSNIVTIWVNGTLMNNTTGSGTVGTIYSTTDPNTIIGSLANASTGTYGIFDEARVFNRALTNAEALILWNEF